MSNHTSLGPVDRRDPVGYGSVFPTRLDSLALCPHLPHKAFPHRLLDCARLQFCLLCLHGISMLFDLPAAQRQLEPWGWRVWETEIARSLH